MNKQGQSWNKYRQSEGIVTICVDSTRRNGKEIERCEMWKRENVKMIKISENAKHERRFLIC